MRLFISTAAALVLCACVLAACSPQDGSAPAAAKSAPAANGNAAAQTTQTTKPAAQNPGDTRRISVEETQKAVEAGTALVVDVRDAATYKTSHIKGAKSVPLAQFDQRIGELPKDKLIITYCA
jgi:ABC-type oligopeptide transport system substrate-binding subunit